MTSIEQRPMTMSHSERLSQHREKKNRMLDDGFARVDAIYWKSAIFSREAMTVNHLSAHRYGDRQALGVYRILATVLMLILFVFLTIYEVVVTKNRFYLTFAWWVSFDTLLFFSLSLLHVSAYFGDKVPKAGMVDDGTHPFLEWKFVTS